MSKNRVANLDPGLLLWLGVLVVMAGLVLAWSGILGDGGDGAPTVAAAASPTDEAPTPTVEPTTPDDEPTADPSSDEVPTAAATPRVEVDRAREQGTEDELLQVAFDDLVGVPGPDTTGVRDGVELEEVDSLVVSEDGAVVEGVRSTSPIRIMADDVTLRDVEVVYAGDAFAIHVQDGFEGLTVEHSTIELRQNDAGKVPGAGVYSGRGTVVRNTEIRGVTDGIKAASGSVYEGNWIHLERAPDSDKHLDAIQNAADDLVIRGNLLEVLPEDGGNATYIATVQGDRTARNITIEGNVLSGGTYTLFVGSEGECHEDVRIVDNVFVETSRYGHVSRGGCPVTMSGNWVTPG